LKQFKTIIPNLPFENRNGTSVKIDSNYFGTKRKSGSPIPGPFKKLQKGVIKRNVWHIKKVPVLQQICKNFFTEMRKFVNVILQTGKLKYITSFLNRKI
jgi:hypothetical protein